MRRVVCLLVVGLLAACDTLPTDDGVPPFTWHTPITFETLRFEPSEELSGLTLHEIVNSEVTVRADGAVCSDCHYQKSVVPYRPAVDFGQISGIEAYDWVDQHTWASMDEAEVDQNDWAHRFTDSQSKPLGLRAIFLRWIDDGCVAY